MAIKNPLFLLTTLLVSMLGFGQNSAKLMLANGQKYTIENKFSATSTQSMMGQSMDSKADFFTSNTI